ncbi:hypothetical protein HOD08_04850, partial [bacterium]|nr:hypothetical protein [bacterium]
SQNNLETLTAQLKTDFPEGIYKVKSQVVTTRATKYSRATQAHLLVAAGKNKVAVMAFGLTQAQQYTVGTDYYKLYTMTDMGEIYDIAISPHSIKGHIAVGGQGGVSLLRTAASGLGWDAIPTDLTVDSLNAATFKRIYTAEPVYRLHCDANTTAPLLHFAVDKSIYTIPLTAANLTDAAITTALPTATQAVVAGTPTTLTASERITDFAIVSDADTLSLFAGYFVGTTKRLFYQKLDGEAGDGVEIKSSGYGSSAMEGNSLGAISQISLVENARGTAAAADTQDMELNVLASDIDDDTCKFYRFAVETATAAATIVAARIKRLYQVTLATDSTLTDHWLDLGRARGNFYADGLFMLHTMPHHLGRTDCVNKISMQNRALRGMNAALYTALGTDYTTTPTRTAALVKATEASMDIHKATTDIYVSPIEHISATGSWMTTVISTTAGSVRVNE